MSEDSIKGRECPMKAEKWCNKKCAWYDAEKNACAVKIASVALALIVEEGLIAYARD